jgi:lysylphosphatidylglycerol synthetase-like protein (DUF2156 family)
VEDNIMEVFSHGLVSLTPLITDVAKPTNARPEGRVAAEMLERYADHPSAYLAMNPAMRHFTSPNVDGLIVYRSFGGVLFQLGGVFAPPAARAALLDEFRAMARRIRQRICTVQLRPDDLELYQAQGFCINQFGASYTLDLTKFQTKGTRFMKMRNKIARAANAGIVVHELGPDAPRSSASWNALHDITRAWLGTKPAHAKLLEFLVGEIGERDDHLRRVFLASHGGAPVGFISYVPSYGQFAGLMHDVCRRVPEAPPGVMELVNATALKRFQAEGIRYLNFGLTPFSGLSDEADCVATRSKTVSWLVRMLAKYGNAIYPAATQVQYKLKWQPQTVTPEYVAFEDGFRWSSVWQLLRLSRAI